MERIPLKRKKDTTYVFNSIWNLWEERRRTKGLFSNLKKNRDFQKRNSKSSMVNKKLRPNVTEIVEELKIIQMGSSV